MRKLTRNDYEPLKKEIYRECDRLNKQSERAAKNYGINSPVYKDIERQIVSLVQSTGTYINPYRKGTKGELKISLSEHNIDVMTKSSISKNMYIRSEINKSKSVNVTNLVAKYQSELTKSTGQQYFATNLKDRRNIVKEYEKIQTISESNLWNVFGSEMGNAKKAGKEKEVLTILFDIQKQLNKPLDINDIGVVFTLWGNGTNVRNLNENDLERLKNVEIEKDEIYNKFIRD